jgi:hypothetical protein
MNGRNMLSVAAFTALGLIVGYAVFGKLAGHYVSLKTLFSFGGNALETALRSMSGIDDMRNKVLLCGLGGAVIGVLATFRFGKSER